MENVSWEERRVRRVSLGDNLLRTAIWAPDKEAIVFRDQRVTYKQFNEKTNRMASALTKLGIKKGDVVSIFTHNCPQWLYLAYGLLKLGAILSPVNYMFKGTEVAHVVNKVEAKILFVEDDLIGNLPEAKDLPSVNHYGYINLMGKPKPEGWLDIDDLYSEKYPNIEPETDIDDNDIATIIFTGGTETLPKGTMNSHLNYSMTALSMLSYLATGKIQMLNIPLYHMGACEMVHIGIPNQATFVILDRPDLQQILEMTKKEKAESWVFPPTVFVGLTDLPNIKEICESLKTCIAWGGYMPPALLKKWMDEIAPNAHWMTHYGQTESTGLGATNFDEALLRKPESLGRCGTGLELRIFDQDDNEVGPGVVGEIVMRGPLVMLGYYKDEEKTKAALRGGWLHSGDLAWRDEDGDFFFFDRAKDIVRTGGENVSSAEVEGILHKHPKVQDATIVGFPDEYWGEAVTAIVVPLEGEELTQEELIAHCKKELAGYKVPKRVITVNEIPRNPSGKVLKRDLREMYK